MGVKPDDRTTEQEPDQTGEATAGADSRRADFEAQARRAQSSRWHTDSRAATREREVPWWANGDGDESPPIDPAQALAAFYDRRAPAALGYCARMCKPEGIADAVEEAFAHVFEKAAMNAERLDDDALDRLLRAGVRAAAARRAAPTRGKAQAERRVEEAERAYDALSGDDAPALGRSLLGELIESEPFAWPESARTVATPEPEPEPVPLGEDAPAASAPDEATVAEHEHEHEPEPAPEPTAKRLRRPRLPHVAPGWRRRVAIVMGVVGTLLLAEAAVTLAWKEPLTAYIASQTQDDLNNQLDDLGKQKVSLGASEQRSLAAIRDADARSKKRMSLLAARLDQSVGEGEALGRIQIDRIGIDFVFVQGTDGASLRKGPGHYHGTTVLPGQDGVVGIAGHRTTYGAPFREVDSLKTGDRIALRMPYGLFTYEVTGHRIVPADYGHAFTADEAGSGQRLVLSACHPLYSDQERILVDSKLVASQPLGSAVETIVPAVPGPSAKVLARRRTAARLKLLGDRPLVPGTTGPDVRELQRLLGMPVTGTFDPNTSAAVLAFQHDHGLPQVGTVGTQTKRALARQPHLPSRPPTPADVPQQKAPGPTGAQGQQGGYSGGQNGGSYRGGGSYQGGGTYTGPSQTTP
jgi:sortase A